jgi:PPOX class probable F420-dependent enzyme
MATDPILNPRQRTFLVAARRAVLATTARDGRPRLVPICYIVGDDAPDGRPTLYTPLDEKPKLVDDPRDLARVRDLLAVPDVTLLVDRWSEDWSRLGWVRLYGSGVVLEPRTQDRAEHAAAVTALRAKYPQYATQALESRPIIRLAIDRAGAGATSRRAEGLDRAAMAQRSR